MDLEDLSGKNKKETLFAFLIEDEDQMAARNQATIYKRDGLRGNKMSRVQYLTMTIFQYFIGNTDWSIEFRHNIKLLASSAHKLPIPIPYDFDHAGLVAAPYAHPAEALRLNSVKDRRYRGICMSDLEELSETISKFVSLRDEINTLIDQMYFEDEKTKRELKKYCDAFYETLSDPKKRMTAFNYPCLPNGTGNVVIRGLK